MSRTDIHAPAAAEFDPANYRFVGAFDLHPEDGTWKIRRAVGASLTAEGFKFSGVHPTGQCDHCGAHIRYEGLLVHTGTKEIITVGEQCLDNRFMGSKEEFAILRAAAARKAKETHEANARNATKAAAMEWLTDAADVLIELSYVGNGGIVDGSSFLTDIAYSLNRRGFLTTGQASAAERTITRQIEWNARNDARRIEEANRKATATNAPTGRVAVTGKIERTWTKDSDYGTQFKMRVAADDGFIVISTIPAAIFDAFQAERPDKNIYALHTELAGRAVTFTATLEPTSDDPTAAWAKRPSKAQLAQ